jgi:hypothetical protein
VCKKCSKFSAYCPATSRRTTKWTLPSLRTICSKRAQLGITGGGFDELQLAGGRLQIVVQEGGVMAVARGVDAHADAERFGIGLWLRNGSVVK